tara:strand:- start:134 stop:295 length:162 start_codon:yes stop_codon:yes gene_type:complete
MTYFNLKIWLQLKVLVEYFFIGKKVAVLAKLGIIDCYRGRILKLISKSYIFLA